MRKNHSSYNIHLITDCSLHVHSNIDRDEFDNAKNVIKNFHKRYLNKS